MRYVLSFIGIIIFGSLASAADCIMYSESVCSLNRSSPQVTIEVHYPNHIFCGIRILALSPSKGVVSGMPELGNELIVEVYDNSTSEKIREPLRLSTNQDSLQAGVGPRQLFIAQVTIKTKWGQPLDQVISSLIKDPLEDNKSLGAFAVPVKCEK